MKFIFNLTFGFRRINGKIISMFRLIFTIALIATPVLSYSEGAPAHICDSMTPNHGDIVSQTSAAPYILQAPQSIKPGQKYGVSLRGQSKDDTIKGFVIQARDGSGKSVGTFVAGPNSQPLDCDATANALTHKKILTTVNQIDFEWIAPNLSKQNIEFVATVAKAGNVFWVKGVKSRAQIS